MNFHSLLNTIILALSLATIAITVTSFFVYKVRQVSNNFRNKKNKNIFESEFFVLYQPQKMSKDENVQESPVEKNTQRWLTKKVGLTSAFIITTLVLVFSLVMNSLLAPKSIEEQRLSAAQRIQKLKQDGLLQSYYVDLKKKDPKNVEFITDNQKYHLDRKINALKKLNIGIFTSNRNQMFLSKDHKAALQNWTDFFKNQKIPFKTYNLSRSNTQLLKKLDLVVFPQAQSLSESQRQLLKQLFNHGVSFVFTGAVGVLNGVGKVQDKNQFENLFHIQFVKVNSTDKEPINTKALFKVDETPYWNLPPGVQFHWPFLNKDYFATQDPSFKNIEVQTVSQSGHTTNFKNQSVVRWAKYELSGHRQVWMNLDPYINGIDSAELHYENEVLVSTLLWASHVPQIKLATWPENFKSALVLSINAEDQFKNLKNMTELLNKNKTPATVFAVSDFYKNSGLHLEPDSSIEFATHSDNHDDFKMPTTLLEQFTRLQTSALEIEELSEKPVVGFRPPREIYNNTTLNALLQARFEYLFADQRYFRLSPLFIERNDFVFFPRILRDDSHLVLDGALGSMENLGQAVLSDINQAKELNGGAFLNFHTQIFGKYPYLDAFKYALENLDKKDLWVTQFVKVADWWKERDQIRVHIQKKNHFSELVIENLSDAPTRDFLIYTDNINLGSRGLASENNNIKIPSLLGRQTKIIRINTK